MQVCYSAGDKSYGFCVPTGESLPELAERIERELWQRHPTLKSDAELPSRVREGVLDSLASEQETVDLGALSAQPIERRRPQREQKRRRRPIRQTAVDPPSDVIVVPRRTPERHSGPAQVPSGVWTLLRSVFREERRRMVWNVSRRAWQFFTCDWKEFCEDAQRKSEKCADYVRWSIPRIGPALCSLVNAAFFAIQAALVIGTVYLIFTAANQGAVALLLIVPGLVLIIEKMKWRL